MNKNTEKKFEILSGKQKRLMSLILLLEAGKDRSSDGLGKVLQCSAPTFHRLLAELRTNYDMDVEYNSSLNEYHIISYGCIDYPTIQAISTLLSGESDLTNALDFAAKHNDKRGSMIMLDEQAIKEIDNLAGSVANNASISRGEIIETAVKVLSDVLGTINGKFK